ncbi:MAG: O-antigen ligase family protein, partial [Gammaproteobacteria bacterium]|nr:O-antigen ligase family protein [Gammaproteobacteria bacterium]
MTDVSLNGHMRNAGQTSADVVVLSFIAAAAVYFYFSSTGLMLLGLGSGAVTFFAPGAISLASVPLFALCLIAAAANRHAFVILLPFVMLAFPSAINDLAPSMFIGPASEGGAAPFPLLTHIDIYLLLGLYTFGGRGLTGYRSSGIIVGLAALLLLQSAVSLLSSINLADAALLATGNYHARFLVLCYLLVRSVPEAFDLRRLSIGLVLALSFLFIEAFVFSGIEGHLRLTSGTLGNNAFAQIVSAAAIYLIFAPSSVLTPQVQKIRIPMVALCILVIVWTGTRVAMANVFIVSLILAVASGRLRRILPTIVLLLAAILGVWSAGQVERFSAGATAAAAISQGDVDETLATTSSLFTRLTLYKASAAMLREHPVAGVGAGRWNQRKSAYGVPFHTLLDPHNGYLAFLSQYGWFAGAALVLVLLLWPAYRCLKFLFSGEVNPTLYAGILPLAMLIPELTNASSFKPGVAAFLMYVAVLVLGAPSVVYRKVPADWLPGK